jgi:hypothetical protein
MDEFRLVTGRRNQNHIFRGCRSLTLVLGRGVDGPFLHCHDTFRVEGPNDILQCLSKSGWKNGNKKVILNNPVRKLM